ncbi:hypothetical protein [Rosistilla oblonga]|uniref:hypothetical protein n=1 Tax=Rosistilla oblonga TaxID=2527990 RepID=UPI003A97DD66
MEIRIGRIDSKANVAVQVEMSLGRIAMPVNAVARVEIGDVVRRTRAITTA